MSSVLLPFFFTIFVWWFSTGFILWLDRFSPHYFKTIMLLSSVVLVLAFIGLYHSSRTYSVASAYCTFSCALLIWGWQELGFLLGYVTGSRKTPCPENVKGWQRAKYAFQAVNHHELALVILLILILIISIDAKNLTGLWTFLILWLMRQSAKLNIFFGVLNLNENFLPVHLKYLQTYFRRAPMNFLMPISLISALVIVVPLWSGATIEGLASPDVVSKTILATLLSLAILEHVLLVIPIQVEFLWKWGFRQES
jgi:putative photosynthetic complex assembly protein 2